MITPTQVMRWLDDRHFTTAVARLLANGRCHSPAARARLLAPDAVKPAALGLALQRVCELNYRMGADAIKVAGMLLDLQRIDGLFGSPYAKACDLAAASAAALRGMVECRAQACFTSHRPLPGIDAVIDRGWAAFARMTTTENAACSLAINRHADLSIILWQLGDCEEARSRLPVEGLAAALRRASVNDDLQRLAIMLAA